MGEYAIVVFIFGIIILSMLIILFFVNNLLLKKERVDHQFESVVKYINDRVELLNRILTFVEENVENEQKYVANLEKISISLSDVKNSNQENLQYIKQSNKLFQKFIKLGEVYPNLKKNDIYNMLIDEMNLNEDRIIYATESYERAARKYNELKQTKINSKISKVFKIKDYEYYNK